MCVCIYRVYVCVYTGCVGVCKQDVCVCVVYRVCVQVSVCAGAGVGIYIFAWVCACWCVCSHVCAWMCLVVVMFDGGDV